METENVHLKNVPFFFLLLPHLSTPLLRKHDLVIFGTVLLPFEVKEISPSKFCQDLQRVNGNQ